MMLTLTVDTDSAADIERAKAILDGLQAGLPTRPSTPVLDLTDWCAENLDDGVFGPTRRETVRFIAAASPGQASMHDVYDLLKQLDDTKDKEPSRVMGGLHKTMEGSWRKAGLDSRYGCFFETLNSGFRMSSEVAAAVLAALGEVA